MSALKLLAAASAAYVLTRAAFIFVGWAVALAVVALAAAAVLAWRRRERPLAVGLVGGAALSGLVLSL